jgi:hypothetical protein
MMIRPFDLRDVTLVAQLEHQGTPLNAELALTRKPRLLQTALASFFSLGNHGVRTYICRGTLPDHDKKVEGLLQIQPRENGTRGYVTFAAPALASSERADEVWEILLEYASLEAGSMGLHHLIAEAPEDGREVEVLRRAGFAVNLRQDILRLDADRRSARAGSALRPCEDVDTWAVRQLYFNTAPRLAHLVEGLPRADPSGARGYVYEVKGELAAYVEVRRGPHGAWVNLLVHPDAEAHATQIVSEALAELGPAWDSPIFCGVRRYQEWLRRPLESLGFEAFGSSVLMVKHLVAYIAEPELALAHASPLEPA